MLSSLKCFGTIRSLSLVLCNSLFWKRSNTSATAENSLPRMQRYILLFCLSSVLIFVTISIIFTFLEIAWVWAWILYFYDPWFDLACCLQVLNQLVSILNDLVFWFLVRSELLQLNNKRNYIVYYYWRYFIKIKKAMDCKSSFHRYYQISTGIAEVLPEVRTTRVKVYLERYHLISTFLFI